MTDEKKPTNLVSIDCKKPTEEETPEYRERITNHLKDLVELSEAGKLNHIAIAYEMDDDCVYNSLMGISANHFRMHYILKNTLPSSYEQYYLCRTERQHEE